MPQSRKRQVGKRKGRKGLYPPQAQTRRGAPQRTKIIAIGLLAAVVIGGSALLYKQYGGGSGGNEVTTPTGLRYVDQVEGTGPSPQVGQKVSVHYTGTLESGVKFDSSRDPGKQPLEFVVGSGGMIKGFDEGVRTMKVGGRRKLIIPPKIGYGAAGKPPLIPPNSTLIFDIELLSVK